MAGNDLSRANLFMIKRIHLLILFLLPITAVAQTGTLTGVVTDAKTGEPLIGATVILEGTSLGDATDENGKYFINRIPTKSYNIIFSLLAIHKLPSLMW